MTLDERDFLALLCAAEFCWAGTMKWREIRATVDAHIQDER